MKNKLRQVISALITEELNEMARIATTLAIGDTTKLAKAKSLFGSDNWIGKMIAAVEAAGEAGITRDALIDATDKNQLALNPKIKDFIEIGLFIEAGLETAKKEKSAGAGSGLRGRKASDKTLVAKEVNSKLEADNEYQANEAELETLGAEFIEKLRMRVKGTLRRGRPADPTKVKDGLKKTLKGIMGLDTDEDGIIDDFEDEDVIDESLKATNKTNKTMKKPLNEEFKRMQKLAGLITENKFKLNEEESQEDREKFENVWNSNTPEYLALVGTDPIYDRLDTVVNDPMTKQETWDWVRDINSEDEDDDDMIEAYSQDGIDYTIMERFAPQLAKNLVRAGFTYDKDEEYWSIPDSYLEKLPESRRNEYTNGATSYGIIWDFWGMDYDTSPRENISDKLDDAAQKM